MGGSYKTDIVRNDIYAVALYNGDPSRAEIVPVPTEAFEFFGLARMQDTFSKGLPKIGDNNGPILEERNGVFHVTDPKLRNSMFQYLVLSPGPGI